MTTPFLDTSPAGKASAAEGNARPPDELVRDEIERWRGGDRPDAASFLSANPDVKERKTLVMDLIYEEFCLRNDSGERLAPSTFCQKFPTYKQSIQRMLDVHQFMDSDAEAAKKAWTWPKPGETVLGFKLVELLGAGAIARVYLAQQPELGERHVVVKIARDGASEAKLMGKLEHPSIVPVHSVHNDAASGMTCICMPFLGTATLTDLLDMAFSKGSPPASAEVILTVARKYRPVGVRETDEPEAQLLARGTYAEGVIHLGVQLAEALAAAHDSGVMHRDIKPSNVLLSSGGRAMLLDFNLSSDMAMPLERVGGTVAYMPPERLQALLEDRPGAESKIDPRADVYSLGALLYELLCGELPSRPTVVAGKQPSFRDWLKCRLTPPGGLTKRNSDVDARMERVILKSLHPDPAERYGSAAEFGRALQECLSWKTRAARWSRRHRRGLLAGGVLALVAIAAAVAAWASREPYDVRMFKVGEQAYAKGDSKAAIDAFSEVLIHRPNDAAALFARAQARRQSKDYLLAKRDYKAAHEQHPAAEILSHIAFCDMQEGHGLAAFGYFEMAIKDGYSTPEMLHNMAYCLSRTGRPKEAVFRLEALLKNEPNLYLSHHVCARLELDMVRAENKPLPDYLRQHIEKALSGIGNEPLLLIDAARIYTYASRMTPSPADDARTLEHLHQAVLAGVSEWPITKDSLLSKKFHLLSADDRARLEKVTPTFLSTPLYFQPSRDLALPISSRSQGVSP